MEWQPIETAPKDGTHFLACDGGNVEVCRFMKGGELVVTWNHDLFSMDNDIPCDATHWMPLPEPPKGDA